MIPTLDIVRLFASRGVKVTIITTPHNLPFFTRKNKEDEALLIHVEVFRFPTAENGLPDGCEIVNKANTIGKLANFAKEIEMVEEQIEQYLKRIQPNCLVADTFLPWATDCAAKFNIPRLVFHGIGYFSLCVEEIIRLHMPYKDVLSDDEPFIISSLPHDIKMTRSQILEFFWKEDSTAFIRDLHKNMKESEFKSYGVIVNSFYELEPDYAYYFSKTLGRRAWHIGPVSLCNKTSEDKALRGEEASKNADEYLKCLDKKKQDSVLYICSGSFAHFNATQLHEIAMALEASQLHFIWVVKQDDDRNNTEEWMPQGFEQIMEGKGMILTGWAPQLLILEHEAVGAFLTHYGWNSTIEGISAGVPMITWPINAEQFYNEKLVTEILKIGVPVGVQKWSYIADLVKQDAIVKALREIMEGAEAQERRIRAKKIKEMAQQAIEVDGSWYSDLGGLIDQLKCLIKHH